MSIEEMIELGKKGVIIEHDADAQTTSFTVKDSMLEK